MADALIYGSIYDQTAMLFVQRISEIEETEGSTLEVKVNSNGGNPEYGWGMVSKYSAFKGEKSVQFEGKAYSMGLAFGLYAPKEKVSCLDVSQGLLHRASYGEWFESSSYFTDDLKTNLDNVNSKLSEAAKNRLDIPMLESIMDGKAETKGKKFKDIWSMDGQLNVFLTAKEMKAIGLVGKIIKITPSKVASVNAQIMECAAMYQGGTTDMILAEVPEPEAAKPTVSKVNNQNKNSMTPAEYAIAHPTEHASLVASATLSERNRVSAFMKFNHVDPTAVAQAIESGSTITENQAFVADMIVKMNDPNRAVVVPVAEATTTNKEGGDTPEGEAVLSEVEKTASFVDALINPKKVEA
jgi:ATP-dependent protease ClpP protease subunit